MGALFFVGAQVRKHWGRAGAGTKKKVAQFYVSIKRHLFYFMKTVFARLDSFPGCCSSVADMNAKRIRDALDLCTSRQLGYRDVPERRNRTRMFVCAGCHQWLQEAVQVLSISYKWCPEYLSEADTS